MDTPYLPQPVSDVQLAFPASVLDLMPPQDAIPPEFAFGRGFGAGANKWQRFITDKFFRGLESVEFDPKPGIDPDAAWRHVLTILGSWEPKHEHKEEAAAYLLSLWFEDVRWVPK